MRSLLRGISVFGLVAVAVLSGCTGQSAYKTQEEALQKFSRCVDPNLLSGAWDGNSLSGGPARYVSNCVE